MKTKALFLALSVLIAIPACRKAQQEAHEAAINANASAQTASVEAERKAKIAAVEAQKALDKLKK